jgi:hypothetical protein
MENVTCGGHVPACVHALGMQRLISVIHICISPILTSCRRGTADNCLSADLVSYVSVARWGLASTSFTAFALNYSSPSFIPFHVLECFRPSH